MDEFDDLEGYIEDDYDEGNLTDILIDIIDISKQIGALYKDLIFSTSNSEMVLNKIEMLKSEEDSFYDELQLDFYKEQTIRSILLELASMHGKDLDNVFCAAVNDDLDNLWMYRIMDRITIHEDKLMIELIEKLHSEKKVTLPDNLENIKCDRIEEALGNDFRRAFVFFMDEEINNCTDQDLKISLLDTKYKLIYVTKLLENEFLNFNDYNHDKIYFNFKCVSDALLTPKELLEEVQEATGVSYLDYAVSNIELTNDFENGDEKLTRVFSTYFRAGLAILYSHNYYDRIIQDFKYELFSDEDVSDFSSIEPWIINGNPDREKCLYLSLNR